MNEAEPVRMVRPEERVEADPTPGMAKNIEGRDAGRRGFEEVGLEIGRDHAPSRRDTLREPERDRAAAGADFETALSRAGAESQQVLASAGVERSFETREADALVLPCVVVGVVAAHVRRVREPGWRGPSLKWRPS